MIAMSPLRRFAKTIVFGAMDLAGTGRRSRLRLAGRLVVLTYHSFCEGERKGLFSSLPVAMFERHLVHLRRHYDVVSLAEGLDRLETGETSARPMVAITIDDGFADNYTLAFPLLKRYGVPATIFLATDFLETGRPPWPTQIVDCLERTEATQMDWPVSLALGVQVERARAVRRIKSAWGALDGPERLKRVEELRERLDVRNWPAELRPLSWEQVREMQASSVAFGSHTVYHSMLREVSQNIRIEELVNSRDRIEEVLGEPCDLFAYPDGAWDEQSAEAVARAGYRAAVTQEAGSNRGSTNRWALRRMEIPAHDPETAFRYRVGWSPMRADLAAA